MCSLGASLLCIFLTLSEATAEGASLQTAYVQVVIASQNSGSDYTTYTYDLQGSFVKSGATTSAEGDILQIHPLGLCNTSGDDNLYEYGWVGVVKLTEPELNSRPCMGVFDKAKRAIQRGATALIFDVTDDPGAAAELNSVEMTVDRPVVVIEGEDAEKLMNIVKRQKIARARINYQIVAAEVEPKQGNNEYFDMVIFMAFFVLVSIICFILLLKIKWKQKQKETSLTRMALHAVSRMEARKYISSKQMSSIIDEEGDDPDETLDDNDDSLSCTSCKHHFICVICLERFKDGQEIRIVPCQHEFHRDCVDPWLLTNHTCPLCMLNIVETEHNRKKPSRSRNILPFLLNYLCSTARNRLRQHVLQDSQITNGNTSQSISSSQDRDIESTSNQDISVNSTSSQLGSTDHLEALRRNESLTHSLNILNRDSFIKIEDSLCYSYSSKSSVSNFHRTDDDSSLHSACGSCVMTAHSQNELRWNFHKQHKQNNDNSAQRTCGYMNPSEGQCICHLLRCESSASSDNGECSSADSRYVYSETDINDSWKEGESINSSQSSLETVKNCIQQESSNLSLYSSQSEGYMRCQTEDCGIVLSDTGSEGDGKDYAHSIVVIAKLPGDMMGVSSEDVV